MRRDEKKYRSLEKEVLLLQEEEEEEEEKKYRLRRTLSLSLCRDDECKTGAFNIGISCGEIYGILFPKIKACLAGERSEEVSEDCEVREKKIMVRVAKKALRTKKD